MYPEFKDLPFYDRPDLTPYLIHLTKSTNEGKRKYSAFDNLVSMLETGEIWGSQRKGYIKGKNSATCFMDIPFVSLKYVLNKDNTDRMNLDMNHMVFSLLRNMLIVEAAVLYFIFHLMRKNSYVFQRKSCSALYVLK
jgi:hypothetical protein